MAGCLPLAASLLDKAFLTSFQITISPTLLQPLALASAPGLQLYQEMPFFHSGGQGVCVYVVVEGLL